MVLCFSLQFSVLFFLERRLKGCEVCTRYFEFLFTPALFPRETSPSPLISWCLALWLSWHRGPLCVVCHVYSFAFVCVIVWLIICLTVESQLHEDRPCLFHLFKGTVLSLQCVAHYGGLVDICWMDEWMSSGQEEVPPSPPRWFLCVSYIQGSL